MGLEHPKDHSFSKRRSFQDVGKERFKLSGCPSGDRCRYVPAVPFTTQTSEPVLENGSTKIFGPRFVERGLTIEFSHRGDKARDNGPALNKGIFDVSLPLSLCLDL